MKKKIILSIVTLVVLLLAGGGYYAYDVYRAMGLEAVYVENEQQSAPKLASENPPITSGDSDWLNWRGEDFKGKSKSTGIVTDWSDGLEQVWEVDYLCEGKESMSWAAPVVRGNRLVIPGRNQTHDLLFCLHAETGELIWRTAIECQPGDSWGTGPRATPTITDSLVYTFGRSRILACWKLADGTLIWKKDVMDEGGKTPEWGHTSPPLVLNSLVIVQGGGEARLIAFDRISGDVVWKTPGIEAGYAPTIPMKIENSLILLNFHGTGLAGVDPKNGQELWSAPWETSYFVNCNTPIVRNDSVFVTSGYKKGSMLLKVSKEGYRILWESDAISSHLSDQILLGDYLYGYTKNAGNRGPFACVEFATGKEVWSTKEIGGGSIVWVDGYFVALGVKGDLFLVKPDPDQFILAGSMDHAIPDVPKSSWTPPVVANGKLYLRYLHKLVCYDIGQ